MLKSRAAVHLLLLNSIDTSLATKGIWSQPRFFLHLILSHCVTGQIDGAKAKLAPKGAPQLLGIV